MNRACLFLLGGFFVFFMSVNAVANTLIKQRPTTLIDLQYQSESDDELAFRYAQIGYIGNTGDIDVLVNLDLVNADKSTSQQYTPILDEAWVNYEFDPIFSIKLGMQRTAFGMAYSRRDGRERFINRGGLDVYNFNEGLGLTSKLRLAKQGFWQVGLYNKAERTALIDSANLSNFSDTPSVATRLEYQYFKALHAEVSFFWQLYSQKGLNNQFAVDFGLWGQFTPKLRGELEVFWTDGIRGVQGDSARNVLWALEYRFSQSWKGYFRYQVATDDPLNLQEDFFGGAQYNLNNWSKLAAGWQEVSRNPEYSGLYRSQTQLFLQVQFQH